MDSQPVAATASGPVSEQQPDTADAEAAGGRGRFVWLLVAAAILLWLARDVLGPFIVAAVIAYAFSPLVTAGVRRTGWPRPVVVGIGYAIAVLVLALLGWFLAGRVAQEIGLLAASGPDSL